MNNKWINGTCFVLIEKIDESIFSQKNRNGKRKRPPEPESASPTKKRRSQRLSDKQTITNSTPKKPRTHKSRGRTKSDDDCSKQDTKEISSEAETNIQEVLDERHSSPNHEFVTLTVKRDDDCDKGSNSTFQRRYIALCSGSGNDSRIIYDRRRIRTSFSSTSMKSIKHGKTKERWDDFSNFVEVKKPKTPSPPANPGTDDARRGSETRGKIHQTDESDAVVLNGVRDSSEERSLDGIPNSGRSSLVGDDHEEVDEQSDTSNDGFQEHLSEANEAVPALNNSKIDDTEDSKEETDAQLRMSPRTSVCEMENPAVKLMSSTTGDCEMENPDVQLVTSLTTCDCEMENSDVQSMSSRTGGEIENPDAQLIMSSRTGDCDLENLDVQLMMRADDRETESSDVIDPCNKDFNSSDGRDPYYHDSTDEDVCTGKGSDQNDASDTNVSKEEFESSEEKSSADATNSNGLSLTAQQDDVADEEFHEILHAEEIDFVDCQGTEIGEGETILDNEENNDTNVEKEVENCEESPDACNKSNHLSNNDSDANDVGLSEMKVGIQEGSDSTVASVSNEQHSSEEIFYSLSNSSGSPLVEESCNDVVVQSNESNHDTQVLRLEIGEATTPSDHSENEDVTDAQQCAETVDWLMNTGNDDTCNLDDKNLDFINGATVEEDFGHNQSHVSSSVNVSNEGPECSEKVSLELKDVEHFSRLPLLEQMHDVAIKYAEEVDQKLYACQDTGIGDAVLVDQEIKLAEAQPCLEMTDCEMKSSDGSDVGIGDTYIGDIDHDVLNDQSDYSQDTEIEDETELALDNSGTDNTHDENEVTDAQQCSETIGCRNDDNIYYISDETVDRNVSVHSSDTSDVEDTNEQKRCKDAIEYIERGAIKENPDYFNSQDNKTVYHTTTPRGTYDTNHLFHQRADGQRNSDDCTKNNSDDTADVLSEQLNTSDYDDSGFVTQSQGTDLRTNNESNGVHQASQALDLNIDNIDEICQTQILNGELNPGIAIIDGPFSDVSEDEFSGYCPDTSNQKRVTATDKDLIRLLGLEPNVSSGLCNQTLHLANSKDPQPYDTMVDGMHKGKVCMNGNELKVS